MLLELLVGGAAVAGIKQHWDAQSTNERAETKANMARNLYDGAQESLKEAQEKTKEALTKLGQEKKKVLDTSMERFLQAYEKVKNVQLKESVGLNEIAKFTIDQQGALEMRSMEDLYSSALRDGATGAAAGAFVALAASGSLTIVTGELATAGAALMAGEAGAAAGIAGSALSFGAAMTPLAAVAAPALLITGLSAKMKAEDNLEKANAMYAEAEAATEKMKISETLCDAITKRSDMYDDLLVKLNRMFAESSEMLANMISKKEKENPKKALTKEDFSENDFKLMAVTRALAGAVKAVIDTPILNKDGVVSSESENVYAETNEKLTDFSNAVNEVGRLGYALKPAESRRLAKKINEASTDKVPARIGWEVICGLRQLAAIVTGALVATLLAWPIATLITTEGDKYLFIDAYVANVFAIWSLLGTSIAMMIGDFKYTWMAKLCGYLSAIGSNILYVQYCRNVPLTGHCVIISVGVLIACVLLYSFLDNKAEEYGFLKFLSLEVLCILIWPIGFFIYALFDMALGFAGGFFLVVTAILGLLIEVGVMQEE